MQSPDPSRRVRLIRGAGWFIILLSAGAALLPLVERGHGATIMGVMLFLAGAAEIVAGTRRHETRRLAVLAGAITAIAGLLFATEASAKFAPGLMIIAGWLILRSLVLVAAWALERGSVRWWTGLSALTDAILAVMLIVGLSIATIVVALFGPTGDMIASFAWVLAISFVATGSLLLEVASCAAEEDV